MRGLVVVKLLLNLGDGGGVFRLGRLGLGVGLVLGLRHSVLNPLVVGLLQVFQIGFLAGHDALEVFVRYQLGACQHLRQSRKNTVT